MVVPGFRLRPLQSLNFLCSVLHGFAELKRISDTRVLLSWWWSVGEVDSWGWGRVSVFCTFVGLWIKESGKCSL